jgi:hypothetical protein
MASKSMLERVFAYKEGTQRVSRHTPTRFLSSTLASFNLRVIICSETRVNLLSSMLAALAIFARFVGLLTDFSSSRGGEDRLALTSFETTFDVTVTRALAMTPLTVRSSFCAFGFVCQRSLRPRFTTRRRIISKHLGEYLMDVDTPT